MAATLSRLSPQLPVICLTYLLYFGQLGILTPYLGLFLDGRGFDSADIGTLFAIITLTRIIGPTLWAGLADKRGNPLQVMQFGCFLTVILFSAVFFVDGFVQLTLVFALMMMFWTAVLPQLEVITLNQLKSTSVSYGNIRLWGSIGFILMAVIVGRFIDWFGTETPIYASMLVLTGLFLSSLAIKSVAAAPSGHHEQHTSTWSYALKKPFMLFIVSGLLLQMSFGAYYGFFALYMRDLGYNGTETGLLVSLGVLAEIGIFLVASRLIARWGVKTTLLLCLCLTALRWWALGFMGEFWFVVITSQLIHAFSFGLNHATSVHFIHHFFPAKFQSRGQAIYISISFGIGGSIGHYLSGYLWQDGAGAVITFTVSGLLSVMGAIVLLMVSKTAMEKKV